MVVENGSYVRQILIVRQDQQTFEIAKKGKPMKIYFSQLLSLLVLAMKTNATNVDHKKIVNPHNFKYMRNPGSHVCSPNNGSDVFLLVYIHSAPGNFKSRLVIRETWSQKLFLKSNIIRVVFMMGQSMDEHQNSLLDMEYDRFSDIVQEDFHDSYRNLTYKGEY
jgi:hypothetical protein